MNKSNFESIISEQGRLIYTNEGDSMFPFIQPRDLLVIEAVKKPLKKYDIPLYKRNSGQYVLHRIVKIKNGEFFLCGDNRIHIERGIRDRHIIGVLTKIIRNGKELDVNSKETLLNISLKCKARPFRRFARKFKVVITKIIR